VKQQSDVMFGVFLCVWGPFPSITGNSTRQTIEPVLSISAANSKKVNCPTGRLGTSKFARKRGKNLHFVFHNPFSLPATSVTMDCACV
jgi:hypothetical protein